ncbi:MAG: UDP-N-acetylmuramoyl-tripeptide--D-alanyl-D-alanine ligase [Synergistetes bacterium]|nr:UDP-N-acetylmuramoyl-tripeptide--D-alanyl-D-alanine ligase [Synergistota bacterium]MDW8192940.1 UDP-N-acetylmuramoyl-tripeptide--D-alanyl-D-alanine ligase [Synergistota bacterium]
MITIRLLSCFLLWLALFLEGKRYLHMLQLEGYKTTGYLKWVRRNLLKIVAENWIIYASFIIFFALKLDDVYLLAILGLIFLLTEIKKIKGRKPVKKPLVFTWRATRTFITFMGFNILLSFLAFGYFLNYSHFLVSLASLFLLAPLTIAFINFILLPVEMLVQGYYLASAKRKIRGLKRLITVGITGSYGKTSTKHFMAAILSERYNVLMTPGSYNTLMGVTRVIRESLSEEHDVFVCEMGAKYRRDIRDLARLALPKIGVITSIGPQHLETFKSIDNIIKTKFELVEELPLDGVVVLNGDNEYCFKFGPLFANGRKLLFYGFERLLPEFYIWAEDIKVTSRGSEFRVRTKDGHDFKCHTILLGRHNISNILAAIAVALELGLTPKEIVRGVRRVEPVPHRLQILRTSSGVTIIDDTFNSNPAGFREALNCLKEMEGGRKVVVTPGMIELGDIEYEENKKLGKLLADVCDYVILVGKRRAKPILDGLSEVNFPGEKIEVVSSLNEAKERLSGMLKAGDIVLFENDLPDNYSE